MAMIARTAHNTFALSNELRRNITHTFMGVIVDDLFNVFFHSFWYLFLLLVIGIIIGFIIIIIGISIYSLLMERRKKTVKKKF